MRVPVSVIIPCYRCSDTIERAVASVLNQTMPPQEIILVEDCSDDADATLALLHQMQQRFQQEVDIKIIRLETNQGPGGARNAGWEAARQPYIAFLDADDSWHPKKLEIQYQWMEGHPEVTLTGHKSVLSGSDGATIDLPERMVVHPISGYDLLLFNCFPARSVMLRREIAERFEPCKRYAEDYLLWLKVVLGGASAWLLELPLAYSYKSDFGDTGLSGSMWEMETGELDTYRTLFRSRMIPVWVYAGLIPFSLLKFLRRLLMRQFRHGQAR